MMDFRLVQVLVFVVVCVGMASKATSGQTSGVSSTKGTVPAQAVIAEANVPCEFIFTAQHAHADPFQSVVLDVVFTDGRTSLRN